MKRLFILVMLGVSLTASAQNVSVKWEMSDAGNAFASNVSGDEGYTNLITCEGSAGANMTLAGSLAKSDDASDVEAVDYNPAFTMFVPSTWVRTKTDGYCVCFTISPSAGHTFKPKRISFDATKVDTSVGSIEVYCQAGDGEEVQIGEKLSPARNRVTSTEALAYSHFDLKLPGTLVSEPGKPIKVLIYSYNIQTAKAIAYRNVLVEGVIDEPADQLTATGKPLPKPLNRGLMSVSLTGAGMGSGNLISWRFRESDDQGTKFKLYRGTSAASQTTALNSNKYIIDKTNFRDSGGNSSSYYKLETYDKYGNLLSTEVSGKTWGNQVWTIPTKTPVDNTNGATYSPNDASFCDMDGDGEYEIILKWSPSNEKDAASTGTTSNPIFDCYKLDGTQLWRIDLGPNFFNSAHTIQFIAWDFDGDGYGEFMCKTAPGTIDGQGKYVLLGSDSPTVNLLSGRGKQDHGSEYITVFDGQTGAEISTIKYHTDYNAGLSYWGDDKQNRSERYLAALAYLDGPDKNPCPIFARGYYSGAFIGAYDFDGKDLKLRWLSKNTTSGKELWGEGAHWISVGDCDGDTKQEIVYGSAALDHNGSVMYRTGLGHGDALHLGDFLPDRPGLEVFMAHEAKPYGVDLRDAKTGELILHPTASGDTGRGLAAHFDSSKKGSQFIYSASGAIFDCDGGKEVASSWSIGSSGAGINCRVYWTGDLYDEFFDKSIIAHWNPTGKAFDRIKFNNGNYLWGKLNNGTKYNPCVLGDILGDWREEIVTWDETSKALLICATSYESSYRIPHLMDDLNYRVQVVNQNCCYNQPPHLSFDPSVKYGGNPNVAQQEDQIDPNAIFGVEAEPVCDNAYYTLQGVRVAAPTRPGIYIKNGKKIYVR